MGIRSMGLGILTQEELQELQRCFDGCAKVLGKAIVLLGNEIEVYSLILLDKRPCASELFLKPSIKGNVDISVMKNHVSPPFSVRCQQINPDIPGVGVDLEHYG